MYRRARAAARAVATVLALTLSATGASAEDDAAPSAAPASVEVLYTGFARNADNSTNVYVRMTGEVPVSTASRDKQLTYHLTGASLKSPNNQNPLLTEHFGPPVSRVSLVTSKDGVDLVIDLSAEGQDPAPYRFVSQGGQSTLHVSFPPPSAS